MTKRGARRKWLRMVLWLLLAALVLPCLQAGCVRFADPPVTGLMLYRKAESAWRKDPEGAISQRSIDLGKADRDFLHLVLVSEDQRFFQHRGFDWKEIDAARARAERTGRPLRGASTISMQCARTLFLWPARSWVRKGLEAYYTFWLELLVPKRRILELYVNYAEFGPRVYGVQAAARKCYEKDATRLSRSEAAMLVALLPAPTAWNPDKPSPRLRRRFERLQRTPATLTIPGWRE